MKINWQPATDAMHRSTREFVIETHSTRPVTGAVWLPETNVNPEVLMCFGHGASGDRYQAPICDLAARFCDEGIACLSLDGPVHGLRRIEPGGREALMKEMQDPEAFHNMTQDWQTAVAATQLLPGLEQTQLGYFGLSMGSIFGIPFLASQKNVIAATLGLLGTKDNSFGQTLNDAANQIQFPVRYIMQLEDELFDRPSCLNLFDQLASTEKSLGANPGLHPEVPSDEIDLSFNFLMRQFSNVSNQTKERKNVNMIAD